MGPLEGVRVVELGGIGPGPFACMLLADLGADVVRIERPGYAEIEADNHLLRGRPRIQLDLKDERARADTLELVASADVLVEGFRPGVTERLGIGPEECMARNPRLVYGRMTGWGQDGPYAGRAGHDINYLAISGVLDTIGRRGEPPVPPVNYVADYGGGGMLLALGVACALVERGRSGEGQVVDAAMVDGAALMLTDVLTMAQAGQWHAERGANSFDTGSHFYEVYETADGRHMAVGAFEPEFYAELLARLGIDDVDEAAQFDEAGWPAMKERFAKAFARRSQAEWIEVFGAGDACVSPVLSFVEAPSDAHLASRKTFVEVGGRVQPAPAPRFGRSGQRPPGAAPALEAMLERWSIRGDVAGRLLAAAG